MTLCPCCCSLVFYGSIVSLQLWPVRPTLGSSILTKQRLPAMDALNVSDAQKAKLQNVADHLLQIYKTLARMRYLDPDWIIPGPHDIESNIEDYLSHGLEDSIIYLYSVLPYIEWEFATQVDFYEGGEFIDLRNPSCLAQSREPLYAEDDDTETMKPWMTPLVMGGNDGVAIVYSAKMNLIWLRTASHSGSLDPVIMSGDYEYDDRDDDGNEDDVNGEEEAEDEDGEGGEEEDENEGEEDEQDDEDEQDEDEQGDEEDQDDEDEDEDDEDEEYAYSEDEARSAASVLRDINTWFLELKVLPGGGEYSSLLWWNKKVTKSLYEKHGWPSQEFDGDAFLIDLVRADARGDILTTTSVSNDAEKLQNELKIYQDPELWKFWEDALADESDLERQWQIRYKLWHKHRARKNIEMRLAHLRGKGAATAANRQHELSELQKQLEQKRSRLEEINADLPEDARRARLRQKQAQQDIDIYTRAYEQAKAEAGGDNGDNLTKVQAGEASTEKTERQLEREMALDSIEDAKAFLETIPSGIDFARQQILVDIQLDELMIAKE